MLAMRIQPDEGILLRFAAKVPELGLDVRSVNMDFTYGSTFLSDAPEAYETLLLDAMLGDASLFTRADEVEAAWSLVTPLNEMWQEWGAGGGSTKGKGRGTGRPADDRQARRQPAALRGRHAGGLTLPTDCWNEMAGDGDDCRPHQLRRCRQLALAHPHGLDPGHHRGAVEPLGSGRPGP